MMMAQKRYVCITSRDRPGFIEFHFSLDDPTLCPAYLTNSLVAIG